MSETPRTEQSKEEPGVEIKEYNDVYKKQVRDLIDGVYENEMHQHSDSGRPDLDKIPEIYQENHGGFWVAVKDGKIIGTIGLIDQGNKKASLHRFCVGKNFRGREKGISRKLFSTFKKFAEEQGYKKIFLGTWENAEGANKFYLKNGFRRIEFLPDGLAQDSYMLHDEVFYELNLEKE